MGFDLWSALGISPSGGLAVAGGVVAAAALTALRLFRRSRAAEESARIRPLD